MDMQQIASELQKFADAHQMNIDVSVVIDNMDAGDFIALNQAMDSSDNRSIAQLLQKYKARMSECYKKFNSKSQIDENNELISRVQNMSFSELHEAYKSFSTYSDASGLSTQEIKTLVYEDLTTQLRSNQLAKMNTNQQQQQQNPQTQAKLKQAELQRNMGNIQVTVPGQQSGTDEVQSVVGVDAGANPQQSLVVTKNSNKPNDVNVFSLDDVTPVQKNQMQNMSEEVEELDEDKSPSQINQEVMAPQMPQDQEVNKPSPLTNKNNGMGDMIQAISNIEKDDDIYGDESVQGNSAQEQNDDIIDQIIDYCSRMRGF